MLLLGIGKNAGAQVSNLPPLPMANVPSAMSDKAMQTPAPGVGQVLPLVGGKPAVHGLRPTSPEGRAAVHFQRARQAFSGGDYLAAAQAYRQGLGMDRDNIPARIGLARSLYLAGRNNSAQDQLEQVLMQDPLTAEAAYLLGVMVDQAGDWERAEALYGVTLRVEPKHAGAHYFLACQKYRFGSFSAAAEHLRKALEIAPGMSPAATLLVLARGFAGTPDSETVEHLSKRLEAEPKDLQARYALVLLLTASADASVRRPVTALEMARALQQEVQTPAMPALLARAHAANGEHDKATALGHQLDGLPLWRQSGASGTLWADLQAYRRGGLPADAWRLLDPMLQAPLPNALGPMRSAHGDGLQ